MNDLKYYKSLVTDEEVINALIRESKIREGEVEKTRLRPNINFFQRTVSNILTSNKRIPNLTNYREKIINKEMERDINPTANIGPSRRNNFKEMIRDILAVNTKFVPSSKKYLTTTKTNSNHSGSHLENGKVNYNKKNMKNPNKSSSSECGSVTLISSDTEDGFYGKTEGKKPKRSKECYRIAQFEVDSQTESYFKDDKDVLQNYHGSSSSDSKSVIVISSDTEDEFHGITVPKKKRKKCKKQKNFPIKKKYLKRNRRNL